MLPSLGEALWRLEAELLAPTRSLKGLRQSLGIVAAAVEESLAVGSLTAEEEQLVKEGEPHARMVDP